MSFQHKNLAEVWQQLQGRHDIANILREIIGQHSVDSTSQEDGSRNTEDSIRTIIWIKAIFDLQRCYLSGSTTSVAECPPYVLSCLLPSELLFSSVIYLVHVKQRLFSSQTTLLTREFTRPRHILSQTLLSGLRLLLLRKEKLAPHNERRLQTAINSAWQHDRLHGIERFVVSDLFAGCLDSLNETTRDDPYATERSNARLPTYAEGLYPLSLMPETFVTNLIHGTMEEDWIDAYWVLFDCLWAVECAITQRYVDMQRQFGVMGSTHFGVDTDEMLEQLQQSRTSLIVSTFHITGPMTPPPSLLDSLALTLLDWNDDLDSFLSRQDSLVQQHGATRPIPSGTAGYGRHIHELSPYFEAALKRFSEWLGGRKSNYEQFSIRRTGVTSSDVQDMVKDWITRMTSPQGETLSKDLDGSFLPVYVVDCPKLHVIPKKYLEYKLRWTDKWAFESIQENSPIVNWKEGVLCPSCTGGEKIKFARLIEPFQPLMTALENFHFDDYSLSQYSVGDSGSYDAASVSLASRPSSQAESVGISLPSQSTMNVSAATHVSRSTSVDVEPSSKITGNPPGYSESPVSPATMFPTSQRSKSQGSPSIDYPVSPLNESLNVPIPVSTRFSMQLPIPVLTPPSIPDSAKETAFASANSDVSSIRLNTPSTDSIYSGASVAKSKAPSRTVRIANSIRRRPTTSKDKDPHPLPKEPSFTFSASGHSLLLWGKDEDYLVRFDIPSNDTSAIQGCKYSVPTLVEAAAAGNHKCAVVTSTGSQRRLLVYDGINLTSEHSTDLETPFRVTQTCLAVSRNDKYVATSLNDHIQIFSLEDGLKAVPFHHQLHVYEMRGGISHKRTIPIGRNKSEDPIPRSTPSSKGDTSWFGTQTKGLSTKEMAEEQQRQGAIISRKLYFSTDSKRLVVATQLGDHCVYIDVWDCTREPVSTISEHSRSFKLPPWTLNDGDLTSIFYDSMRRSAIVTAFLGKEYPMLVPFPGYDTLQNETYSTKIVHAAQSPSGTTFIVANAMTEIIQFEYTPRSMLSPRKLKKSSAKISASVFKPGHIALAMPLENVLQMFWVKDGKCMLRTIKIGTGEVFRDYDIRPHWNRLMGLGKGVITRAPSMLIPELE
ncbi:hypothetical protein P154DRAFT_296300 [Amniculicola lignicola CBS 123094]|uniref:WD40 repeat-like protein n=1 Tax=Amniculicola lignicola CBS 123094 TaxID=1392246 RepID=A0A6A5W5R9_9PLEO|nr:hypothetical protein P154DRAFT_296300 [Amniculicola lignicola CBS 123094]